MTLDFAKSGGIFNNFFNSNELYFNFKIFKRCDKIFVQAQALGVI